MDGKLATVKKWPSQPTPTRVLPLTSDVQPRRQKTAEMETARSVPEGGGLSADVEGGSAMVMLHGNMDGQSADRVLKTLQQSG